MIPRAHRALLAILAAAIAAGCTPAAERQATETLARDQLLCKADQGQACVRYLDSTCQANLDLCATLRSDQAELVSDLEVRCGAGDHATCLVLEGYRCDSGDDAACESSAKRYNQVRASCRKDASSCAALTESAWPNRMIATAEKSCQDGDPIACRVADAAHTPAAGAVVTIPADYRPSMF
jgi:hypothetical protein